MGIVIFATTAIGLITDRSRTQRELVETSTLLHEAQETIQRLQVSALNPNAILPEFSKAAQKAAAAAATAASISSAIVTAKSPKPVDDPLSEAAKVITSRNCRRQWLSQARAAAAAATSGASSIPLPFAGGDLEVPGVFEAALKARAPDKELIFLSVGDTRDHRRQYKDPSLRTISIDFLRNLLANLKGLGIGHYLILTTETLCRRLQKEHCEVSCVWTSLWHTHPGLSPWNLKPGDMFLMWAQQWRYIARAMELGYRVLRSDTDVYLAENPYPILHGPLFKHFEMVVQHDFFGARERPRCDFTGGQAARHWNAKGERGSLPACGRRNPGLALLNIGLTYLRSRAGGGVHAVINSTWARFLDRLAGPPSKPAHLRGGVDSQALIDQPFMRSVVNDLAVADPRYSPPKRSNEWAVIPGTAGDVYDPRTPCALGDTDACATVKAERRRTAFLVQTVRPPAGSFGGGASSAPGEFVALAPDWLFGRGCLTHLRAPMALLRLARAKEARNGHCAALPGGQQPSQNGHVPLAPGPASGLLVATHFVYSMALKRKRAFRAFGWDLADGRNRSFPSTDDSCFKRSHRAMLFGHTFFDQTRHTKSVLCALPSDGDDNDDPACPCCAGLGTMQELAGGRTPRGFRLETTGGSAFSSPGHFQALEGCNDYQMFWD